METPKVQAEMTNDDVLQRLVPSIPLELLYRRFRKQQGSKKEQYELLHGALNGRHGPKGSVFLAELFRRSVRQSQHYCNVDEPFHAVRKDRVATDIPFAKLVVKKLITGSKIQAENHLIQFVDYEIFPFRTTKSCCENGKPATSIGSGGMDLLLASTIDGAVVPAIGEIKAKSEHVGPTFALIQAMMYAAQLATQRQFLRLKQHYPSFSAIDENQPKLNLFVFIQVDPKLALHDLKYAQSLAMELCTELSSHLRQIVFLKTEILNDVIQGEVIDL